MPLLLRGIDERRLQTARAADTISTMSSAAPLQYAPPARLRRHVCVRLEFLLLWTAVALLVIDLIVHALPAFRPFYAGSRLSIATEWAHSAFALARVITSLFAVVTIAASFGLARSGWALRLARSIAVALAAYHWFFAPGDGTYGRLLWGAC